MPNFTHPEESARFNESNNNIFIKYILPRINSFNESVTSVAKIPDRSFAVTENTCPRLYEAFHTAWQKLKMDNGRKCTLFCSMDYDRNIKTSGTDDDALIVVSSTCLEDFSDKQLLALLGREVGHLKLNHLRYLVAFNTIDSIAGQLPNIVSRLLGVDNVASAIKGWLFEMLLVTQYSADRAGAIVAGDILPVIQNNLMIAGIEHSKDCLNFEDYLTENLRQDFNNLDRVTKVLMINALRDLPMPFAIPRIKELVKWSASEDCRINFPALYRPPVKKMRKINVKPSTTLLKGQRFVGSKFEKITFTLDYDDANHNIQINLIAFLVSQENKVLRIEDVIFYKNICHDSGAIVLDSENSFSLEFSKVPTSITKISFAAMIPDADKLQQNFGSFHNLTSKFSNTDNNVVAFPLADLTNETAIIMGEFYRYKQEWKFKAIGEGFFDVQDLFKNFGINLKKS